MKEKKNYFNNTKYQRPSIAAVSERTGSSSIWYFVSAFCFLQCIAQTNNWSAQVRISLSRALSIIPLAIMIPSILITLSSSTMSTEDGLGSVWWNTFLNGQQYSIFHTATNTIMAFSIFGFISSFFFFSRYNTTHCVGLLLFNFYRINDAKVQCLKVEVSVCRKERYIYN